MAIPVARFDEEANVVNQQTFTAPIDLSRVQCHYCGYEPSDHAHLPATCPKCGGSAWEHYELRGGVLAIEDDAEHAQVEFKLHCPAVHAYLFGNVRPQSPRLIEMEHVGEEDWSTKVSLPPGRYFYRFYINDGRLVFYVGTVDPLHAVANANADADADVDVDAEADAATAHSFVIAEHDVVTIGETRRSRSRRRNRLACVAG